MKKRRKYTTGFKSKGALEALREPPPVHKIGRKRVQGLMGVMGIESIDPKPRLSIPLQEQKKHPYLLRNLEIKRSNQVWCTDITYIPLGDSYIYLGVPEKL